MYAINLDITLATVCMDCGNAELNKRAREKRRRGPLHYRVRETALAPWQLSVLRRLLRLASLSLLAPRAGLLGILVKCRLLCNDEMTDVGHSIGWTTATLVWP